MIRFRRRNTAWLVALGSLIGLALASGTVAFPLQVFLLAIFLLAITGSLIEQGPHPSQILEAIQRAPVKRRVSPQAREAAERAKSRGNFDDPGITLMDIGLIALQSGDEGIAMRRTRTISKDDDGVRPFIQLHVAPEDADRQTLIRYEILDHNGQVQFVHEMKTYLRDGEMDILLDHHLPLMDNDQIQGVGDWDLRVHLDNNLIGMHNFTLAPSVYERHQRIAGNRARNNLALADIVEEEEEVTLKQLLHQDESNYNAPRTNRRVVRSNRRRS